MKLTAKRIKEELLNEIKCYENLAERYENQDMINTAHNLREKAKVLKIFLRRINYLEEN